MSELMFPSFVHHYEVSDKKHTYKGSLSRHVAIEKVLCIFGRIVAEMNIFPLSNLFFVPIIIGYGLNCGFPSKDVVCYVVWKLKRNGEKIGGEIG